MHRRHLVFRTIGGPIGIFRGDDVCAGYRVVEGRVEDTGWHPIGYFSMEGGCPDAARKGNQITLLDATKFGVMRMDLEHVLIMPLPVFGPSGLRTDIVLAEDTTGGQYQGEGPVCTFMRGDKLGQHEAPLTTYELADMHDRGAFGRGVVTGPLDAAQPVELLEADAGKGWRDLRDLVHDLRCRAVAHGIAHGGGQTAHGFPFGQSLGRFHDLPYPVDTPFGIGKGAVLFQE